MAMDGVGGRMDESRSLALSTLLPSTSSPRSCHPFVGRKVSVLAATSGRMMKALDGDVINLHFNLLDLVSYLWLLGLESRFKRSYVFPSTHDVG